MLAGIVLLAAWAAIAPVKPLPVDSTAHHNMSALVAPSSIATTVAGSSANSPLYVRTVCDRGCASVNERETLIERIASDPVALFTGLLFLITALLWWTTHKTLRHAEKVSEYQLRAYISVCKRELELNADGQWWCTLHLKNIGQTPALNMQIAWEQWTDDYPVYKVDESANARPTNQMTLFPSQEVTAQRRIAISNDEKVLILSKTKAVWVKGRVTYDDAFGNSRFTKFHCYTHEYLEHADHRMTLCKDGNSAS